MKKTIAEVRNTSKLKKNLFESLNKEELGELQGGKGDMDMFIFKGELKDDNLWGKANTMLDNLI